VGSPEIHNPRVVVFPIDHANVVKSEEFDHSGAYTPARDDVLTFHI
jgi:hypothetical protein